MNEHQPHTSNPIDASHEGDTVFVQGTPVRIDEKKQPIRRLPSGKMSARSRDEIRRRLWAENTLAAFKADHAAWLRSFPEGAADPTLKILYEGAARLMSQVPRNLNPKQRLIRYFYLCGDMVTRDTLREAGHALLGTGVSMESMRAAQLDFMAELAYRYGK